MRSKKYKHSATTKEKIRLGLLKRFQGRIKDYDGYIYIYKPKHPTSNACKYIFEHRLIMEKHLGRLLKKNEIIHHLNGIIDDNRLENLELVTRSYHTYIHSFRRKRDKNGRFK